MAFNYQQCLEYLQKNDDFNIYTDLNHQTAILKVATLLQGKK